MPPSQLKVVGVGGSMATPSMSLAALNIALEGARDAGASAELFDIATLDLPTYIPGQENVPESALQFSEAVYKADGLVWSSPMYHGTVSGSFKNALDWLQLLANREPKYLTSKVIGLISTAGGGPRTAGRQHDGVRGPCA